MLFNSYEFIFVFLPITFFVYFYLNHKRLTKASKSFLVLSSLFFYSWWNISYLPLILGSIAFNFSIGRLLGSRPTKSILTIGVIGNISLLGYFKYTDFFIENYNWALDSNTPLLNLVLPLAISYFTFQQIAFLVDSYRGETREYGLLNYCVFITFFPQLLMGPIVHHKEIIPQFQKNINLKIKWEHVSLGIFIFAIGLAKKTLLGDPLTDFAQNVFDHAEDLSMVEAWYASLSYVLSYYFDLSGYADMAIGIGKMFNINIPINFNSPYKARNFSEYWKRWHMTLSRFLGDYVYKSLGGNQRYSSIVYMNIMITFFVSGFWHGAGWTFVVWGALNGAFVVMAHMMKKAKIRINYYIAWSLMFLGLIITRILFVSDSFSDAWHVAYTLFDITNLRFSDLPYADGWLQTLYILIGLSLTLFFKNSIEISQNFRPNIKYTTYTVVLLSFSILTFSKAREFLYFQF
jgi:D-alanyl-lipoteichoic acid acyltransferase DltB (MBOAT superfamily)